MSNNRLFKRSVGLYVILFHITQMPNNKHNLFIPSSKKKHIYVKIT